MPGCTMKTVSYVIIFLIGAVCSFYYLRLSSGATNNSPISPTAYYTGYVWFKSGLSSLHRISMTKGFILFSLLEPFMLTSRLRGGPTVENFLLARHLAIDQELSFAVESGRYSHVIELAAGLSSRGSRFHSKYGQNITYIESDLAAMVEIKREALNYTVNHKLTTINGLFASGPNSLEELVSTLSQNEKGLIIITEGLVNYMDERTLNLLWSNIRIALSKFKNGIYLSDIHLKPKVEAKDSLLFRSLLSIFVRGSVHLHFDGAEMAASALSQLQFQNVSIKIARERCINDVRCTRPGSELVHIIRAEI
jgi:O-methyltransferase involved in polyketide biosynthesis